MTDVHVSRRRARAHASSLVGDMLDRVKASAMGVKTTEPRPETAPSAAQAEARRLVDDVTARALESAGRRAATDDGDEDVVEVVAVAAEMAAAVGSADRAESAPPIAESAGAMATPDGESGGADADAATEADLRAYSRGKAGEVVASVVSRAFDGSRAREEQKKGAAAAAPQQSA